MTTYDKDKRAAWYKAHPEQRKKHVDRSNKYRADRKVYLNTLKSAPCMDCGVQYVPYVMDWDHVRGKKSFTVSVANNHGIGMERLIAEIAKCDLVCSNCHRMRTLKRREALHNS